jgi:ubiquinone/menaquinone biosynthesis C-methylase UbiE
MIPTTSMKMEAVCRLGLALLVLGSSTAALGGPQPDQGRDVHATPGAAVEQDVDQWIHLFESPDREIWQRPNQVVAALLLKPGQKVADIGAGSGYFARRFARAVGPSGTVWAVDIEPAMLRYIQKSAREAGLANVVTILAATDDPMLPPGQTDLIFICDTIHHIEDRVRYLKLLRRLLSPDGKLVVIDFFKEELPVGPPPAVKLSRETVIEEAQKAGFQLLTEHLFLPYQYFVVFGR